MQAWPEEPLSRWLWLVKWLLAVPHYIVLGLLWIAVFAVSVVAFFAILITGRYPRSLFEFTVGVMRWTWRVAYYAYGSLATDRYPPFTLADVPDYPAHLTVDYPEHLSRGLVLVKWWLLALPHYVIVGLLAGSAATWHSDQPAHLDWTGGLIGLLVLVAGVLLLFTGRYPRPLYDLVMGLDRWVLRVGAYALLLTDVYPPFRLDMGGAEPGPGGPVAAWGAPTGAPAPTAAPVPPGGPMPAGAAPVGVAPPPPATGAPAPGRTGWTAPRVVALVLGALLGLVALGPLGAGITAAFGDRALRDDGYLTTSQGTLSTAGSAIISDRIDLGGAGPVHPADVLGRVRVRARSADPAHAVFIGVTSSDIASRYLGGTAYARVVGPGWRLQEVAGAGQLVPPVAVGAWSRAVAGYGQQELRWTPQPGTWTIVVANADGAAGVSVTADVGATVPRLGTFAAIGIIVGLLMLCAAAAIVAVAVVRAARHPAGATAAGLPAPPGGGGPAQPPRV